LDGLTSYGMNVMPQWFIYSSSTDPNVGLLPEPRRSNSGRQLQVPLTSITQSQTALLLECKQLQTSPDTYDINTLNTGIPSGSALLPHRRGTNVLFFDGHTEFLSLQALQSPLYQNAIDSSLGNFWSGQ
jgi:prepilin-type processing-associated H-X9-DG protein